MIIAWRLVKWKHRRSAFDGEGARLAGGRWNLPGSTVVYASGTLALAALEIFVHLGRAAMELRFTAIRITLPADISIEQVARQALPPRWRSEPPLLETMEMGTKWARQLRSAVLQVPSVIIPQEHNFILNPSHKDFRRLDIGPPEPFTFDPRLWK
jgi:RES domain-containing protein